VTAAEGLRAYLAGGGGSESFSGPPPSYSVVWDGYGLESAASGVGAYARALAAALRDLGVVPAVVGGPAAARAAEGFARGFPWPDGEGMLGRIRRSKPVWPELTGRRVREAVDGLARPVILHGLSNFNLPRRPLPPQVRTALTLHDLIPLMVPGEVSKASYWQLRALLPGAVARADLIVCVSQWTYRALAAAHPHAAARAVVIPNGMPALRGTIGDERRPGPPRLLYVARAEVYKRLPAFFEILRAGQGRWQGRLVTDAGGMELAKQWAVDLLGEGTLSVASALSRSEYEAEFDFADVYVQTSRLEGFCLPAADALAAGKPVVYEAGSGTDEVIGTDVGVALAKGASTRDWSAAVERALALGGASGYVESVRRHHAKAPSWKDAADALARAYTDLIEPSKR
jgi:glycosyltransferase involved in cell wall biosynthesis